MWDAPQRLALWPRPTTRGGRLSRSRRQNHTLPESERGKSCGIRPAHDRCISALAGTLRAAMEGRLWTMGPPAPATGRAPAQGPHPLSTVRTSDDAEVTVEARDNGQAEAQFKAKAEIASEEAVRRQAGQESPEAVGIAAPGPDRRQCERLNRRHPLRDSPVNQPPVSLSRNREFRHEAQRPAKHPSPRRKRENSLAACESPRTPPRGLRKPAWGPGCRRPCKRTGPGLATRALWTSPTRTRTLNLAVNSRSLYH